MQGAGHQEGPAEGDPIADFRAICCGQSGERCLSSDELRALRRLLKLDARLADLCGLECAR